MLISGQNSYDDFDDVMMMIMITIVSEKPSGTSLRANHPWLRLCIVLINVYKRFFLFFYKNAFLTFF